MAAPTTCVLLIFAALQFTAATQPNEGMFSGPEPDKVCVDAVNPDAWPVKPESQVCGSDGLLYPSKSALECISKDLLPNFAPLTLVEREKCSKDSKTFDPCQILAYKVPKSVCGSDNATYTNIWDLVCAANRYNVEIKMQHEGACKVECPYSPIYKPVCSSTNFTFANEEALKCKQILYPYANEALQHMGECKYLSAPNPCHVTNSFSPSCASNGRTYNSPQHVLCLRANNPDIKVLHDGACTLEEVQQIVGLDDVCRMAKHRHEWSPLCGSDKTTYTNSYTFLCAKVNKTKDLTVAYKGECKAFDYCRLPEPTKEEAKGVCGNDGLFYPYVEALYCAQATKKHLLINHHGPCDEKADDPCLHRGNIYTTSNFLDDGGSPVCGSNSVTYVSPQALWCAAKAKPDLIFLYSGQCF